MTTSELAILQRIYGYLDGDRVIPPTTVPDTGGPTPGFYVVENTRYHIAARDLADVGLVRVYRPSDENDKRRLVRPVTMEVTTDGKEKDN